MATQFKPSELKDILKFHIEGNRKAIAKGGRKHAVNILGNHGIGKTDVVRSVAQELGMELVKINLAQLEELSDLVGFPVTSYQVCKTEGGETKTRWVSQKEMENLFTKGWEPMETEPRMSYAKPEWIANRGGAGVLLIDDWTRADNRFIQACMDLIYESKYISWELPKDWHIILTSNPDDGNYLVSGQDDAQKDRYFDYTMKFSIDDWAEWAESHGIDDRCINFMMLFPEATDGISQYNVTEKNKICVSPRAWSMFFDAMSALPDFNSSITRIKELGEGSVGNEASNLFCQFITQGFDKLISPKEILFNTDFDKVLADIKKQVTSAKDKSFKADVASTIGIRLANYTLHYLKDNSASDEIIKRLSIIIIDNIFNSDITFVITNKFGSKAGTKLSKLFANQKVVTNALS